MTSARELQQQPGMAEIVRSLPFAAGDVIVALGDSITDDSLSWANQLRWLMRIFRPDLGLTVVNAGVSGNTTGEAISRIDTVIALRPAWVIQLLGTNDARRHGTGDYRPKTTSLRETKRNLRAIERLIAAGSDARLVRMTPPPVMSSHADQWDSFRVERISWRDEDIGRISNLVRQIDPSAVDVYAAFVDSTSRLLLPDGIHPSIEGQQLILRVLLSQLVAGAGKTHSNAAAAECH